MVWRNEGIGRGEKMCGRSMLSLGMQNVLAGLGPERLLEIDNDLQLANSRRIDFGMRARQLSTV